MQEDYALLGTIVASGGFERIDEVIEALVDPVDRVAASVLFVPEELVTNNFLFVLAVFLGAMREDHVVHPLERVAADSRALAY